MDFCKIGFDQQKGRPKKMPDLGDLEQWIDELPRHQQQQWRSFHDSAILVMQKTFYHSCEWSWTPMSSVDLGEESS